MGAVPLWRAKCPDVGKRRMSPTRPRMIAAVRGPIPWMPVTVDPSTVPVVEVQLPTGAILRVPAGVESIALERILTALHQATAAQEARP